MSSERKKSILVIDDEEDILNLLSEMISDWDYSVVVAQTLPAALIKINNQRFNVIVLDIMLKKISGIKILEQIRKNHMSMNHFTPIILHSGYISPDIVEEYKGEFDDALVKPAEMNLIRQKLTDWEDKRHSTTNSKLTYIQEYVRRKIQGRNKLTGS
ncbi:MAG: response regulator [Bdellovibrionaceae bacterium]|nr:response regulator [Pseudobdellovibrionaceae bacterium]